MNINSEEQHIFFNTSSFHSSYVPGEIFGSKKSTLHYYINVIKEQMKVLLQCSIFYLRVSFLSVEHRPCDPYDHPRKDALLYSTISLSVVAVIQFTAYIYVSFFCKDGSIGA
jgi:hypothetical protein